MIRMEIKGQDEILKKLRAVSAPETRAAILDDLGEHLVSMADLRFEREVGPDGIGWEQSERAKTEGGQTLTDTGHLRGSLAYEHSADRLEVGSAVKYAGIHQYGGEIRPKKAAKLAFKIGGRLILVDKVTMPARPFLGFTEADEAKTVHIISKHWSGALQ